MQRLRSWFPHRLAALVLLPVAALVAVPSRGAAADIPPLRSEGPPYFSADIVISVDAEGRSQVAVSITVPYQELEWIQLQASPGPRRLGAGVEFTVVFESKRQAVLSGDAWDRRLVVGDANATRGMNAAVLEKLKTRSEVPRALLACKNCHTDEVDSVMHSAQL